MITFNISAAILLCMAGGCGMFSAFFLWQEIGEINRKLPENEQISYWGMHPLKMARIKREYTQLYPSGRIELLRVTFQYASFVFLALMTIPLGFFR